MREIPGVKKVFVRSGIRYDFLMADHKIEQFKKINARSGKRQYLVPYFISFHPGTTLADAVALSEYLRDHHLEPEQVQDFYPTSGSLSTAMYYTGYDPLTMEEIHVPRGREKNYSALCCSSGIPEIINGLKKR